ncbi:hypothetical protein B296_00011518 [Ensete ventricosum]|uniref:Uncharacterized protein n=1 Tax=Ensete ventricosum TaxID=4639 RepID=A0A426ZL83_ENSVE|nr:hypothetical protein B296_00011518 [Ensete ventricosum]
MTVVPSSSALSDSRTTDALAAMLSFFNVDSTVTTHRLVEVRKNYFIPPEYELHIPLSGERPYDAFSFPTEWTSRTVSSSIPALSTDKTELVEILWGILSDLRGVKDMNEAWLAEASLSPAPGASMLALRDARVPMVEKCPSSSAEAGLRKCLRKAVAKQLPDTSGSTTRTSADKGKGIVELEEFPERGYTMRELCEIEDRARVDWEYLREALHPTLAKQVYECSSEELMNRASKLAVWHEKILALRATNKELKASVGQELAAITERRVKELEAKIERIRTGLDSLRSQWREFEQEVMLLHSSLDGAQNDQARLEGDVLSLTKVAALLEAELKAEGQNAVATYKASQGFESGLEKMGRVSYKFEYRVALE